MMMNNLKELARMISERDDISLNEAQIIVGETAAEMEDAFMRGNLYEVEDILKYNLGLEPDYLDLFIM